jgi:hypothetical protein
VQPTQPAEGYTHQTWVTLTAVPGEGYLFDHWTGDLTGNANPASIKMIRARTVTPVFVQTDIHYILAADVAPTGSGRITSQPSQPAEGYIINKRITVTATASAGYQFSHWEGDLTGATNPASLVLDRNKTITAVFNPCYALTVNANPIGSGTVTLTPPQSAEGYAEGTRVTLTAIAGEGYRFDHWSGALSGSENPPTIVIGSDQVITANFAKAGSFPSWLLIGGVVVVIIGLPLGFLIMRRLLHAA